MKKILALVLIVVGMAPGFVHGAEANICRLNVTPVRFGNYNPAVAGDARGNGTITYTCTAASPISIALEHSSGSISTRRMTQGAVPLEYNLYLDAACTIVWGDGTGGTQLLRDPAPPPNTNVAVPIYGCIRAGQRRAVLGAYGENFIVTIQY